ncbi:MAG: L-threonylcarbamoyladenylate synthase [Maribacter sp.]
MSSEKQTSLTDEINKCIEILEKGGLILYPTDTVWGIGCDATNELAVAKLLTLKQRDSSMGLICLVANDAMLEKHVTQVPELAYDIMDLSTKPTTIIYDEPKGVAKNVIASDNTLAIRVATDKFCTYLIGKFKKPIVATSANSSGAATPKSFQNIGKPILSGVDYVVNLQQDQQNNFPSSIIRLSNTGNVKIIRE